MDVPAVIRQAMRIKGKTSLDELAFLHWLARMAPDGPAVEVGVLHGRSLLVLADARRGRGPVYGVDDEVRRTVQGNAPDDVGLIVGLSWEAHVEVPGPLAFCFLDADHGIEAFPKDILPWTAKIMPGGVMVFHDYSRPEFIISQYVDWWQSLVQWNDLGLVDSTKAFRRPDDTLAAD